MKVKFPTYLNTNILLVQVLIMYCAFCFGFANRFEDTVYNFVLFKNDFSTKGTLAWVLSSLEVSIFCLIITRAACVYAPNRLAKSIFFALMIDSFFSILNTIIFGFNENVYAIIARNGFVILALIYSYFILFPYDPKRATNT